MSQRLQSAQARAYQAQLRALQFSCEVIASFGVEEMLQDAQRAQSLGPMLDPSLFMENADKLREDIELLEICTELKSRWQALKERARV